MEHHKLILPEHLNNKGTLFGGYLLKWVDEFAYITACLDFPRDSLVTVGLDNVEFKNPICPGQILRLDVVQIRVGKTSVEYSVKVYGGRNHPDEDSEVLFETKITFVSVDDAGIKKKVGG